jgi:hypothetical protein
MSETNLPVEQQQAEVKPQHPYAPNDDNLVCDPKDKECLARWVAAFGDCA